MDKPSHSRVGTATRPIIDPSGSRKPRPASEGQKAVPVWARRRRTGRWPFRECGCRPNH